MRNAGLDEAQAGIKIAGRPIYNLRYADDTTLMEESEEELKSLLMKAEAHQLCPQQQTLTLPPSPPPPGSVAKPQQQTCKSQAVDFSLLDCANLPVKVLPGAGLPQDVEG